MSGEMNKEQVQEIQQKVVAGIKAMHKEAELEKAFNQWLKLIETGKTKGVRWKQTAESIAWAGRKITQLEQRCAELEKVLGRLADPRGCYALPEESRYKSGAEALIDSMKAFARTELERIKG